MPGFVGLPEILLLGLVVLLIFGPKRLPEMGRSMGRGFREFRDSVTGEKGDEHDRFAVPAEEPEMIVLAPTPEPLAVVPSSPSVETGRGERTLSSGTHEDERAV